MHNLRKIISLCFFVSGKCSFFSAKSRRYRFHPFFGIFLLLYGTFISNRCQKKLFKTSSYNKSESFVRLFYDSSPSSTSPKGFSRDVSQVVQPQIGHVTRFPANGTPMFQLSNGRNRIRTFLRGLWFDRLARVAELF